jgi:3'-5' exoribonuclease
MEKPLNPNQKLTKQQPINTLKTGDAVKDIFVVKIKKNISPYTRGFSFTLILSDSSGGSIEYKYWGGPEESKVKELYNSVKNDSIVYVRGKVSSYQGKMQIVSDSLEEIKVLTSEEYEANFVMAAKKNVEEMYSELLSKIDSLSNSELKKFLNIIFKEEMGTSFKKHPGAISIHHNWMGGLIQHTLEVVKYCETSLSIHPELDRDLLIAGAMLHDIGKLEELEVSSRIKGSRKGQFVGHLTLGVIYVSEKLKGSQLEELFKEKLIHLITSHHGKLEFGSPKVPMLPEACALYYADELSSKVSEMLGQIELNKEATEDDFFYDFKKGSNIFLR